MPITSYLKEHTNFNLFQYIFLIWELALPTLPIGMGTHGKDMLHKGPSNYGDEEVVGLVYISCGVDMVLSFTLQ